MKDRIELLEFEIAKLKLEAAEMYFRIAINEDLDLTEEYSSLNKRISDLSQDLSNAKNWMQINKELS